MNWTQFLLLNCLFVLGGCCSEYAQGFATDRTSLATAFTETLRAYHKPGGYITVEANCGTQDIFTASNNIEKRSGDPFENLLVGVSGYKIDKVSGAVNLVPSNYIPALLQSRINNYSIDSDKNPEKDLDELLSLPELQDPIESAGLRKWSLEVVGMSTVRKPMAGARKVKYLSNVSLFDLLNAIARFHGDAVWGYTEYACEGTKRGRLKFVN